MNEIESLTKIQMQIAMGGVQSNFYDNGRRKYCIKQKKNIVALLKIHLNLKLKYRMHIFCRTFGGDSAVCFLNSK